MMAAVLSICLFIIIFASQLSQIKANVTPILNSTGQYFITNYSHNHQSLVYNSETITCNHPSLCYLECNHPSLYDIYGCTNLVFNTSSSNVIINCNSGRSCYGDFNLSLSNNLFINMKYVFNDNINVYVANDNTIKESTAYINITNVYGYKNFHLENIDVVNIQCIGSGSCSDTTLYCPYHQENACNIDIRWYTPSLNLKVNKNYTMNWLSYSSELWKGKKVTCLDDLGQDTGSISSSLMTYKGINVCQYYSNCCPYSSVKISNDDYKNGWYFNDCIEGYDCFIDCSSRYQITGVLSECGYRIIDASLSTSVHVICPDVYSCDNTRVICPINGGECNVNVTIKYGSNGLRINATSFIGNNLNINLNCLADISCNDTYIFANNTIGSNINMNINCVSSDITGNYACGRLIVNGSLSDLNNINIKYQLRMTDGWNYYYSPYNYNKFYLYSASNVNIHCNGIGACEGARFNLENSSNIDIRCDGITINSLDSVAHTYVGGSCEQSRFYVGGATNVNMECVSNFNCKGTNIFAADSKKLDIVCDGDQSCTDMQINYPPILNQYVFTLVCYDGIFDYSCNGIRIYVQDDFVENFIDLLCESNKACYYIHFHCDTKGVSIVNADDNYQSCLSDNCCPIDGIRSETNKPTTSTSIVSTIQPMKESTTSVNNVLTKIANVNTDNGGPPALTLLTTYNSGVSSATYNSGFRSETSTLNSSWFGDGWIVLIIVAVIFFFICAIYIAYKMGIKKQIKKQQPMIPSFQLLKMQDINNAQDIDTAQ